VFQVQLPPNVNVSVLYPRALRMEAKMPGDPRECRQRALNCILMAKAAGSPQAKVHFYKLAQSWIRLAEDLEQSQAFFAALDDEVASDELEGHLRT
jgi:hypothetical protein